MLSSCIYVNDRRNDASDHVVTFHTVVLLLFRGLYAWGKRRVTEHGPACISTLVNLLQTQTPC